MKCCTLRFSEPSVAVWYVLHIIYGRLCSRTGSQPGVDSVTRWNCLVFWHRLESTNGQRLYSMNRIWWNINWVEFQWINGNFSFDVPSYSVHTVHQKQFDGQIHQKIFLISKKSKIIYVIYIILYINANIRNVKWLDANHSTVSLSG